MEDSSSRRREQLGWYFYDWANSPFYSTVVTLFFAKYLSLVVLKPAADPQGFVYVLGIPIYSGSYWGYLVTLSVVLQAFTLPAAGAWADTSGKKKELLALFAYFGAAATMAMYFLQPPHYLLAGLLFVAANVSYGASIVVYNSFLPDIATESERDAVSSKGWGIGYLGGGIVLAANLLLVRYAPQLGIAQDEAVRISLCSAGVWWAGFTAIPLVMLRNRPAVRAGARRSGFLQLVETLRHVRKYPRTLTFLIAYLLYNDAVQAVITLAGQFGDEEVKVPLEALTLVILMVQFVAFLGALAFNLVAKALGTRRAVLLSLAIWTAVIVAMFWVRTTAQFFVAGAVVGIVLGGTQALSRALFSLMIPKSKEAEYFGLYEITDKGTSWMAPLIFALTLQFTKSYRLAILTLVAFFLSGMAVLARVDVRRAAEEAGNQAPQRC